MSTVSFFVFVSFAVRGGSKEKVIFAIYVFHFNELIIIAFDCRFVAYTMVLNTE